MKTRWERRVDNARFPWLLSLQASPKNVREGVDYWSFSSVELSATSTRTPHTAKRKEIRAKRYAREARMYPTRVYLPPLSVPATYARTCNLLAYLKPTIHQQLFHLPITLWMTPKLFMNLCTWTKQACGKSQRHLHLSGLPQLSNRQVSTRLLPNFPEGGGAGWCHCARPWRTRSAGLPVWGGGAVRARSGTSQEASTVVEQSW